MVYGDIMQPDVAVPSAAAVAGFEGAVTAVNLDVTRGSG
jgi:hypothetical protein